VRNRFDYPDLFVLFLFHFTISQIEYDEVRSHVLGTHFLHIFHILESIDKDYWDEFLKLN
ncbi:hypothetical protein J5E77_10260, partial [Streptococcus pneumoniae]|nr:hypothetical protein [Streptococcus pneumoniae]MBW7532255.1 hypothetical protein [Streptococcus pneumoniae]MBW7549359.1 hypothetical protein [Streptococcus pneumoniae]